MSVATTVVFVAADANPAFLGAGRLCTRENAVVVRGGSRAQRSSAAPVYQSLSRGRCRCGVRSKRCARANCEVFRTSRVHVGSVKAGRRGRARITMTCSRMRVNCRRFCPRSSEHLWRSNRVSKTILSRTTQFAFCCWLGRIIPSQGAYVPKTWPVVLRCAEQAMRTSQLIVKSAPLLGRVSALGPFDDTRFVRLAVAVRGLVLQDSPESHRGAAGRTSTTPTLSDCAHHHSCHDESNGDECQDDVAYDRTGRRKLHGACCIVNAVRMISRATASCEHHADALDRFVDGGVCRVLAWVHQNRAGSTPGNDLPKKGDDHRWGGGAATKSPKAAVNMSYAILSLLVSITTPALPPRSLARTPHSPRRTPMSTMALAIHTY